MIVIGGLFNLTKQFLVDTGQLLMLNLCCLLCWITAHNFKPFPHPQAPKTMAITYPPIFKATFRIREAYGNTRAYPVSREAVLLCQLTNSKTLLPQQIAAIRELGFECLDTEGKVINPIDLY
jgi:hypothetical protein